MSGSDEDARLVGVSRRDAAACRLPDASVPARLMHGIPPGLVMHRLSRPETGVPTQEIGFATHPALGDKVVVTGDADILVTRDLETNSLARLIAAAKGPAS